MREKILGILKNADNYISGEEMSRRLGISRAAVWKHIKKLREEGYSILSVTNKGYRLRGEPDNISPERVADMLDTRYIGRSIVHFNSTDSTNEEAKRRSDMPEGTLFIAETQQSGKGRLGRAWESPRSGGIWASLLLKPDISAGELPQITLAAGVAVCRAIGGGAKIKWPNDIVMGTKKVCGILTEMSAEPDRINYVVCGIGINVNVEKFPAELSEKATSIYNETGIKQDRNALTARVMNEFERVYDIFLRDGFGALAEEYGRECVTLGKRVQVIYHNKKIQGSATGIDESGALIVDTDDGRITVASGEVSVRGIYGYI